MIGETISHYRILEELGAGGMGVVYKAQDLKLERLVAIKFLTPSSDDESAKKRFIQEAKAASSLDHPNICTIHEIDEIEDGRLFIVMALYEGETLRQRLRKGIPSIDEALDVTMQVASGLSKAHEKGIVHRDIKPANILLTDDQQVKILDFGLAKLSGQTRLTQPGGTLGTIMFMSPEQATGDEMDQRSDIFSLGSVLYELLTGELPFPGDHDAAVLYGIVHHDPERLSKHREDIPAELQGIIDKALKKTRDERYQGVEEFRRDLANVRGVSSSYSSTGLGKGAGTVRPRRARSRVVIGAAALIVLTAVCAVYLWNKIAPGKSPDGRGDGVLSVTLEQVTFASGVEEYPAFSPDGTRLVYSAEIDGYRQIVIKDLGSGQETQLTQGAVDNIQAVWSPDGSAIVFVRSHQVSGKLEPGDVFGVHDGGDIWRIDLNSRNESRIIENAFNPSYSSDGERIAFDASWGGTRRIWVADSRGRNPQQVTFDASEVAAHIIPRWSPDNSKIVFQNKDWTDFDIKIVDVASREITSVTDDPFLDLNPIWSQSGDAIYFSSYRSGGLNVWRMPVSGDGLPDGPPRQMTTGAGQDIQLAVSHDGSRMAMSILRLNADIWRMPIDPGSGRVGGQPEQVIATTREDSRGRWSPDGRTIAFNSDRTGDMNIWVYSLSEGTARQLTRGSGGDYQPHWSPDGKQLVFFSSRSGNADIWVVDHPTGNVRPLTTSEALDINPCFSPDGGAVAYQSDQDGRREVWVMSADGTGHRRLTDVGVSGHFLLWSPDGQNVIFRSPSGGEPKTLQVPVSGGEPRPFGDVRGGAHMSFGPSTEMIIDVVGHKTLWLSPRDGQMPQVIFESDDPGIRIDYPVWSPDGQWLLFDRVRPEGGDIWLIES